MRKFLNLNNPTLRNNKIRIIVFVAIILAIILLIIFYLLMNKTPYNFDLGEQQYSLNLNSKENIINNYKNKPRVFSYSGELPDNWQNEFYSIFFNDTDNDALLKEDVKKITSISSNYSDNQAEILVAFVQGSIEYDHSKAASDNSSLQYPIETLFKKKGVCSDKSLLLAKFLLLLDYNVVLFSFPKMNHMAVGISVPKGFDSFNTGYCYIETTSNNPIGRIPADIQGQPFNEKPELIFPTINGDISFREISNIFGKYSYFEEKYGMDYLICSPYKKGLLKKMKVKKTVIDSLKHESEINCKGTLPSKDYEICLQLNERISGETIDYNELVKLYNEKTD